VCDRANQLLGIEIDFPVDVVMGRVDHISVCVGAVVNVELVGSNRGSLTDVTTMFSNYRAYAHSGVFN